MNIRNLIFDVVQWSICNGNISFWNEPLCTTWNNIHHYISNKAMYSIRSLLNFQICGCQIKNGGMMVFWIPCSITIVVNFTSILRILAPSFHCDSGCMSEFPYNWVSTEKLSCSSITLWFPPHRPQSLIFHPSPDLGGKQQGFRSNCGNCFSVRSKTVASSPDLVTGLYIKTECSKLSRR